jgi:hypothetical protein
MSEEKDKVKNKNDNNPEFINPKEEQNELRKLSIKRWISGRVIGEENFRRQLPFILFLAFLGFIYIGNRYHAEHLARKMMTLQQELDELRAESINTAAELMYFCRQSQVQKRISENNLDLHEAIAPPTKIKRYE